MQRHYLNLFTIIFMLIGQVADTKAQNQIAKKADSLFSVNNLQESDKIYQTLVEDEGVNKENVLLKLAYISENNQDFPKVIYYLSKLFYLNPKDEVFEKINKVALENQFKGYEKSDINFILTLFRQYNRYLISILIIINGIIIYNYWRRKNEYHKFSKAFLIYFFAFNLLTLFIINSPEIIKTGILKNEAFLRNGPSEAAKIEGNLNAGTKVNIVQDSDIWRKIYYNRNFYFVNKKDIWLIEN